MHLEVAHDLTTDGAVMAIRRFSGRRGYPLEIWSDNGTNLCGAERELRSAVQELDDEKIAEELSVKRIDWHFNPPAAPHMGGAWERLVRSVKVALQAINKDRVTSDEVLLTLFAEVEGLVNSRPLTHVPVDPEAPASLTPNHFLIGTSGLPNTLGVFDNSDLCLRKKWRLAERLTDHFWSRWVREYLPTLSRRAGTKQGNECDDW